MSDNTHVPLSNRMPQKRNLRTGLLDLNVGFKGKEDRGVHPMEPVGRQGRLLPGGAGLCT